MVTRLLASDRGRLAAILAVLLVVIAGLALVIVERDMRAADADAVMAGEASIVILAGPGLSGFQVLIDPTQAARGAAADSPIEALFVLWLLLVPIAGVVGWRIAGRIVGPVNAAIAVATVAGPGHLSTRVPTPARPHGSWRLATAVNGLLERFERREADRRRLVDDAAHEMRNPLAVMQTSLDPVSRIRTTRRVCDRPPRSRSARLAGSRRRSTCSRRSSAIMPHRRAGPSWTFRM